MVAMPWARVRSGRVSVFTRCYNFLTNLHFPSKDCVSCTTTDPCCIPGCRRSSCVILERAPSGTLTAANTWTSVPPVRTVLSSCAHDGSGLPIHHLHSSLSRASLPTDRADSARGEAPLQWDGLARASKEGLDTHEGCNRPCVWRTESTIQGLCQIQVSLTPMKSLRSCNTKSRFFTWLWFQGLHTRHWYLGVNHLSLDFIPGTDCAEAKQDSLGC